MMQVCINQKFRSLFLATLVLGIASFSIALKYNLFTTAIRCWPASEFDPECQVLFKKGKNKCQNAFLIDEETAIITYQKDNITNKEQQLYILRPIRNVIRHVHNKYGGYDILGTPKLQKVPVKRVLGLATIDCFGHKFYFAKVKLEATELCEPAKITSVDNRGQGLSNKFKVAGMMEPLRRANGSMVFVKKAEHKGTPFFSLKKSSSRDWYVSLEHKNDPNSHYATLTAAYKDSVLDKTVIGFGLMGMDNEDNEPISIFIDAKSLLEKLNSFDTLKKETLAEIKKLSEKYNLKKPVLK